LFIIALAVRVSVERIPLGCSQVDKLLGGGIEKGSVTLIYGEAGAGKTNVCLQLARNVAINGQKVAYIDSEGLSSERLAQVFVGHEDSIKNLLVFEVHSFSEQSDRIDKIEKLAATGTISLVIIDSLTMFYRLNYEDSYVRNDFIRQTEVLLNTARQYEIAVMVTSQVYSNISNGGIEFLGGHALHHNAKTIIRLDKRGDGRRAAVIMKHRSLPEGRTALYRITETGISDP
jgi:DNA repair protein RadB